MKKKILWTFIIFIIAIGLVKWSDIVNKYEMSPLEYLKYSTPLTRAEREYLKNNTIQYGISANDPPFTFVSDDTEQNVGIVVDYFNQLSVALESPFKPVVYDDFSLAIKLKNHMMDAAVLNKTEVNKSVFLFTQTLYTERSKLLVDGESVFQNLNDVRDVSLAVISGSSAHHGANLFFTKEKNVKVILTENLEESFFLFKEGIVDGIIGDEAKISYALNRGIVEKKYRFLEGSIAEEEVALAVNRDQIVLYNILNKGICEMKRNNQYSHINSKWFGSFIPEVEDFGDTGKTSDVFILILSIIFVFLMWNMTVTNRVSVRTKELKASKEEVNEILNSLDNGIIVTAQDGMIQHCNNKAEDFVGISKSIMEGRKIDNIVQLTPFLKHANENEPLFYKDRYFLINRGKMNVEPVKYIYFIDDYTERYRYERINRQEAKMVAVGELSSGLAHEIRNPLGLIKSYLYILKKKVTDSLGNHAIDVMDDSVNRINSLVENLLGFSRMSMDKTVLVDIEKLIKSIINLEEKNLVNNNIKVDLNFDIKGKKEIKINEDIIKLSLINLINNAIDALKEGGKHEKNIVINVKEDDSCLILQFKDNGIGIEKEKIDGIFNPFYTTKVTGTGLGLYIINSEIRGVGGSITARSSYGIETVFEIRLPIEEGEDT